MSTTTPLQKINTLLEEFEIRDEFCASCNAEVTHWLEQPGLADPELAQWQTLPFVTIDNPDSRDLDQALLIEHSDNNGYRVLYALADAAYYVKDGSALFDEALQRGVTYYTPTHSVPMLPRALSEGLISLNPNVDRRALVFDMQLTHDASIINCSIVRACIRSQAKLSYESVQQFLDEPASHTYAKHTYADSLLLLQTVGELLMKKAIDRHVVPFNRVETLIDTDDRHFTMRRRKRVRTEKYNEQISLLCNMQGAQLLSALLPDNAELQAIFRVHDAPLMKRQKALKSLINNFADLTKLDDRWYWRNSQSLAEFVTQLPNDALYAGKRAAIERQILVSNRASEFRSEPGRHHALAASSYARFSSPMREIVGIFTHAELLDALSPHSLNADQISKEIKRDTALQEKIIATANLAKQTQKKLDKAIEFLALQDTFNTDLSAASAPRRNAIIMGFKRDRIYVACEPFASDLKISKEDIEHQYQCSYTFDELQAIPNDQQKPQWQLGQTIEVQVHSFNKENQRFILGLYA